MGRPNPVKKEDNNPRTQIARLDALKIKSSRRKGCSSASSKPAVSSVNIAKLERLKAKSAPLEEKSARLKEIIELDEAFKDELGGEDVGKSERSSLTDAISRGLPLYVIMKDFTAYFLYEFASGYALFEAHGVKSNFSISRPLIKSPEDYLEYLKRCDQIFTLKAFHPFSSPVEALVQMNAISDSRVSRLLKNFLANNLPNRYINPSYYVTSCSPVISTIGKTMKTSVVCGVQNDDLTRGLRMNIDKYIDGLKPKDVEKAQRTLARLYSRQMCTTMYVESSMRASSSSLQRVVVVPHRLEGVFIAKGKEDFICTRNLVPGESLYGEELIFVQNEDGTDVEYKVWNPLRSKFAAAILCGVTNIWVKPGSRILYLGNDVCQITLSHLSDLVGSDGLVYVVGLSDGAVNMAKKRSNVITVYENPFDPRKYCMVVGMVDVIYAEYVDPQKVNYIIRSARLYLRAGGHYMVYTRVNNIYLTSRGKDPFANSGDWMQFTPIEVVILDPIDRAYAMAVCGFGMLEE